MLHDEPVMKFEAHNPAKKGARGGLNLQEPSFDVNVLCVPIAIAFQDSSKIGLSKSDK